MPAPGDLEFVHAGPPTIAALTRMVAAAQGADRLAPVDVVVPSGLAGVTIRRAIAGERGLANVRFATMPQLAERLAARHLALAPGQQRPLVGGDRAAALQRVLAGAPASKLVSAATEQGATAQLLENVFAELDAAQIDLDAGRAALAGLGAEVLALYEAYRAQVDGLLGRADLLAAAAVAVGAGDAPPTHVVLLVSRALSAAELALVDALAAAGRLSVVADRALPDQTREHLASVFGAAEPAAELAPVRAVERLIVAPDADEEVRIAVRTVLEHLASTGCRPERVGVAYASAVPYVRLLAEQLRVATVPHHVPSQRTLAQTVAGRTLTAVVALHARDYPRRDVLRWLADAPILDGETRRVRPARWERISREAGVSRGLAPWRARLIRYADDQRTPKPEDSAEYRAAADGRADDAVALLAQVEQIAAVVDDVEAAATWADAATALQAVLVRVLGARRQVDGWAYLAEAELARQIGIEQQAYDAVAAAIAGLSELDGITALSLPAITDALADRLDVPVPSGTTLGRGVLTGSIAAFAGADLDLLLVLGATESALPARQRENTLLRDDDRAALSPQLATVASRRADQRTNWRLALAGAGAVHLSYPRADSRAQRRQFASPWFLDAVQERAGTTISAAKVDEGDVAGQWFVSHPSFAAALRIVALHASVHELDVARAMAGGVDDLAATDPRLARGLAAARARTRGAFTEWTGATGELGGALRERVDAGMSATSLQTWAECPSRHFYGKVLGIRDLEDPGRADTIDARERGTYLHAVLEDLVGAHVPSEGRAPLPPEQAWDAADLVRATALLNSKAADLTARGLTGREVLWTAQLAKLTRMIGRVLVKDSELRREQLSWPIAVESDFGRNGVAPLVVELPTQGQVSFAGSIDRVEAVVGGGLVVLDYKSGRGNGYDKIPVRSKADPGANLVDAGRKLQLVLYALAAKQLHGSPDSEVSSWFWFIETGVIRGGPVTALQEQQLREALDVVVAGIRRGVYPANPGPEDWRFGGQTWKNCGFCPFDLVCPTSRAEQWNGLRLDPAVRRYAELIEPPEVPA